MNSTKNKIREKQLKQSVVYFLWKTTVLHFMYTREKTLLTSLDLRLAIMLLGFVQLLCSKDGGRWKPKYQWKPKYLAPIKYPVYELLGIITRF